MKEVNIKPGFEMVEKWKVPANNQEDFVKLQLQRWRQI